MFSDTCGKVTRKIGDDGVFKVCGVRFRMPELSTKKTFLWTELKV
jgi:hypothetical protein